MPRNVLIAATSLAIIGAGVGAVFLPALRAMLLVAALLGVAVAVATNRSPHFRLLRRVELRHVDLSAASEAWKRRWAEFSAHLQPGDELWEFSTSPESWRRMAGRAGYVIVRNGKPTKHQLTTAMN